MKLTIDLPLSVEERRMLEMHLGVGLLDRDVAEEYLSTVVRTFMKAMILKYREQQTTEENQGEAIGQEEDEG